MSEQSRQSVEGTDSLGSSAGNNGAANARKRRFMGLAAGAVIVACAAYIGWSLRPSPPVVMPTAASTPFLADLASRLGPRVLQMPEVTMSASEDGAGAVIAGKVKSEALLRELRAAVDASQPKVQVTFEVRVGP